MYDDPEDDEAGKDDGSSLDDFQNDMQDQIGGSDESDNTDQDED